MKKHLFYLSMALITALFSACGNGKKGVFTPTSSGRAYLGFPSRNVHSVLCILLRQTMTLH